MPIRPHLELSNLKKRLGDGDVEGSCHLDGEGGAKKCDERQQGVRDAAGGADDLPDHRPEKGPEAHVHDEADERGLADGREG
eukprot:6199061-Pleurochrysis_carterae.AAC.1